MIKKSGKKMGVSAKAVKIKKVVPKKKSTVKSPLSTDKNMMTVYHKTNCSTSCDVMALLKKKKIATQTILYIENPPTEKELELLLAKLNIKPFELIRQKEKYFKEKLQGLKLNDHEWIRIMVENPVLIERPILIKGNKAIIGRPMEKVLDWIE